MHWNPRLLAAICPCPSSDHGYFGSPSLSGPRPSGSFPQSEIGTEEDINVLCLIIYHFQILGSPGFLHPSSPHLTPKWEGLGTQGCPGDKWGVTQSTPQVGASAQGGAHIPCHLWWPPLLILAFVHSPHSALDVLHAHEALVQAEVVPHSVLGVQ